MWLNTPLPPMEASVTSGMKAALNVVPSLSVLDGWWIEGCIEGVTGWAIDGVAQSKDARFPETPGGRLFCGHLRHLRASPHPIHPPHLGPCTHIANAQTLKHLNAVAISLSYELPTICTPDELMEDPND